MRNSLIFNMSSQQLRFDGRVVLVTGAGNGLGKEYALAFAARGAKVVVNDLGGDSKGEGKSARAADIVVEEIRSKGGIAVANYDSVEEGEKVVKAVLDSFGRIDIIINNAGILRDRSFARISDIDWDIIHRIHLRSVFLITRAAWPHMKNQNYGRVILVSSAAGIYGNFGQANYSAAKLGVLGLANTLAIEGAKNNIGVNVIAPIAASRMTQSVMPEELFKSLKPEFIAPLVLWLCHEDCSETGGLFECGAGWIAKLRWERSPGAMVRGQETEMSPECVRDNWEKITDFTNGEYPSSIQEGNMAYIAALQAFEENQRVKPNKTSASDSSLVDVIGTQGSGFAHSYTERDVILYALGVGVSTQQEDHLKFLFEGHSDFCVLPSFIVIPAFFSTSTISLPIDPTMILHGEQYCELYRPLASSDNLTSKAVVADVVDKGSGAVVIYDIETHNEAGVHVASSQIVVFVQRAGGFGGRRSSEKLRPTADPPKRSPCASIVEKTGVDQAAIYRLSGDRNPLHIDPSFAALGGFSTPILHGLCSFGYAVRHVLKQFCNNDVTKFKAVKVRFSSPVLPGQTLQTDMWKDGSRVFFQCKVVETGKACLTGAYVDLFDEPASSSAVAGQVLSAQEPILKSDSIFNAIEEQLKRGTDFTEIIDASYLFIIKQNGVPAAEWYVNLRKGTGGIVSRGRPGDGAKADCTLTLTDDDLMDLAIGKLSGMQAFTTGRLKVSGNPMLTMRLTKVFNSSSSKL